MGGADYYGITQLPTDDVRLISEIMDFIEANEIFFVFLNFCQYVEHIDLSGFLLQL